MKQTNGLGPISAGASVPSTPKREVGESPSGAALDPGYDLNSERYTSRTAGKFKSFNREPVPKTPS